MGRNKYGLSVENGQKSKDIVIEIVVKYDIDGDKVEIDVGRRVDVISEELLLRLSQQIENSMRIVSKEYDTELKFVELLAGVAGTDDDDDDRCRCDCRE
jgi:hypothetical protein